MSAPKFSIGQVVACAPGVMRHGFPKGAFTITRVMPMEAGQRSYRGRSAQDGQEWVLSEDDMSTQASAASRVSASAKRSKRGASDTEAAVMAKFLSVLG